MDLDDLVDGWLTLPDVAERLGTDVLAIRSMLREGQLVAVRRGPDRVLSVPASLVDGRRVLKGLRGALTILADHGYDAAESVGWLFTEEHMLGTTPAAALADNQPTRVHRAAQLAGL